MIGQDEQGEIFFICCLEIVEPNCILLSLSSDIHSFALFLTHILRIALNGQSPRIELLKINWMDCLWLSHQCYVIRNWEMHLRSTNAHIFEIWIMNDQDREIIAGMTQRRRHLGRVVQCTCIIVVIHSVLEAELTIKVFSKKTWTIKAQSKYQSLKKSSTIQSEIQPRENCVYAGISHIIPV
jgi:hypothetical protein